MKGNDFDVVIIGSGLGGLMCGALLSMNGHRVCVLEKHHQIGGNLQTFKRKGIGFNSAMHYVGSMDEGQILNKVFRYLGVLDSTGLEKLDKTDYEKVYLGDREYSLANGLAAQKDRLLSYFPREERAIDDYLKMIQDIWNSTNVLNLQDFRNVYEADTQYTQMNAYDFIDSLTNNQELKALWGSCSVLYAGIPERSPLMTHAIISYHYIQSAYKFTNGSDQLAHALMKVITGLGGRVQKSCEAVKFEYHEKNATAVVCKDGTSIRGKSFISNIHPAKLTKLVEPGRFRKAYVSRMQELENTIGIFCVYIKFRESQFRNINSNVYICPTMDVWNAGMYDEVEWPGACILYTSAGKSDPEFAESMTVSAFMKHDEVARWDNSEVEKRGKDYEEFKQERAEKLLDLVETKFPGIRDAIEDYYTASPLTFRDYTGTPNGSAYGILKDCNNPRRSYISPMTRIPNLFMTGQNSGVGLHGVLGVTVSSFFTCANFIDIGDLLKEIRGE
jgi:all-trans-retinol 13,14-reductase